MREPWSESTEYSGIVMRSRFEAAFARFLDALGLYWISEPSGDLVDPGFPYLPDFFLPDLGLVAECRGYQTEYGARKIERFVGEIEKGRLWERFDGSKIRLKYLVIGPTNCRLYERLPAGVPERDRTADMMVQLARCSGCNSFFFRSTLGYQGCRHCRDSGEAPSGVWRMVFSPNFPGSTSDKVFLIGADEKPLNPRAFEHTTLL